MKIYILKINTEELANKSIQQKRGMIMITKKIERTQKFIMKLYIVVLYSFFWVTNLVNVRIRNCTVCNITFF